MAKPSAKTIKVKKPRRPKVLAKAVRSDVVHAKAFNVKAHNKLVMDVWVQIQAQIDGLSDTQCNLMLDRQEQEWTGHRDFAKAFSQMVNDEWDGATAEIAGSAVYRAILTRMNRFDPVYRPSPAIIPMGDFDGCLVFYHTADAQFEVFLGLKRQRFTAHFNPAHGMDLEDMRVVFDIIRKWKVTQ